MHSKEIPARFHTRTFCHTDTTLWVCAPNLCKYFPLLKVSYFFVLSSLVFTWSAHCTMQNRHEVKRREAEKEEWHNDRFTRIREFSSLLFLPRSFSSASNMPSISSLKLPPFSLERHMFEEEEEEEKTNYFVTLNFQNWKIPFDRCAALRPCMGEA